jgi:hypothetical protein
MELRIVVRVPPSAPILATAYSDEPKVRKRCLAILVLGRIQMIQYRVSPSTSRGTSAHGLVPWGRPGPIWGRPPSRKVLAGATGLVGCGHMSGLCGAVG